MAVSMSCEVKYMYTLLQVYSPYNLTLDSDTDSGWSMCMATPTCLQPVKRTPLSSTRDDDSPMCTVLDSGAKGEPVGLEAGPSNSSGEKVQNTVSWRPKEKVRMSAQDRSCVVWHG